MASKSDKHDCVFNVVVVGDCGVGKSSLLSQFTRNKFSLECRPTIGIDLAISPSIMVDKKVVRAQIWDTAGLEQYKPITSQYFKGCAGAVIVYDVSNHLTYENTKQWLKELKDCSHTDLVMLVGNKTDLGDFRVVSTEEGKAFAEENGLYFFETSAKDSTNVDKAFHFLLTEIYHNLSQKQLSNVQSEDGSLPDSAGQLVDKGSERDCSLLDRDTQDSCKGSGSVSDGNSQPTRKPCKESDSLPDIQPTNKGSTKSTSDLIGKREPARIEQQNNEQLEILQNALSKERREKEYLRERLAQLQSECNSENREKMSLEQRVHDLQELLADSDRALSETRMILQESEKVLHIQSSDIEMTEKKLGSGSYGEVRIAYWKGCSVAVKMLYDVLADSQHNIDLLMQEVSIAWKIHHPNIASVCGVTIELKERRKTAWIIMELLQGSMAGLIDESRREGVRQLTLREKVDMAHDSLCGLNHLHCLPRPVLHGDIRPTNILITAVMRAKLGDLGAARFSDASLSVGLVSPDYAAPERIDSQVILKNKTTDVYSTGVSLCELFTGVPPNRQRQRDQVHQIQQQDVRVQCMRMLSGDPKRRPSAAVVLHAFDPIYQTEAYKLCPPRRMVKGKLDGVDNITFTDQMW